MNEQSLLEEKSRDNPKEIGKFLWNKGRILYSGIPLSAVGLFTGSRIGEFISEFFPAEQMLLNYQDIQNITYSMIGGILGALIGFIAGGYSDKIFRENYKKE